MYDIIPEPRKIAETSCLCDLSKGIVIDVAAKYQSEGEVLALWLGNALGIKAIVRTGDPHNAGDTGGMACLSMMESPDIAGPEEYRLSIGNGIIAISAKSGEGLIHGGATLWQLVLSEGSKLHGLEIEDGPRFGWRGFMLDCARNFFTVEFIEKMLDLAALHKLNVFHWHLVDDQAWRIDLPSMPELAEMGSRRLDSRVHSLRWKTGCYSPADIRRVVEYAGARHIMVVPEIETPGHSTALLASHPELSCRGFAENGGRFFPEDRYGVFDDILCAGNDRVFAFIGKMLDDMVPLFPGAVFHMGGDEAPKTRWNNCDKCRARMRKLNLRDEGGAYDAEKLQAWFMGREAEMLAEHGKRMGGWDEVLDGGVRKDTLIFSWRGYSGGIAGAKAGYDVVMCPQTKACYLDHKNLDSVEEPGWLGVCTLRDSYSFEPVAPELSTEEAKHIIGAQANVWSEMLYFSRQAEYMIFPRLCALSEVFWSPKEARNFERFTEKLVTHQKRLAALDVNSYKGKLY